MRSFTKVTGSTRTSANTWRSAAAKGGLEKDDVVLELDGRRVKDFTHLRRLVYVKDGGDAVKLKIKRGDKTLELDITLGERPES